MKRTSLIIAFAGLLAGSFAAPGAAQQSETLDTFARADLVAALEANEATYEELADSRSINVTFASGVFANAVLLACTDDALEFECYGTSILATFNREGRSDAEVAEAINTYNYRENFGRAYVDPDGAISVRLYIISDGGITRENYRRQIELWENSLNDFFDYLYGSDEEEVESGEA